jgi:hypothetical protein
MIAELSWAELEQENLKNCEVVLLGSFFLSLVVFPDF